MLFSWIVGTAREAGLRDWAAWAAQHDAEYHLGATPGAVLSIVDRIYQASVRHPLHVGPYRVDESAVGGAMLDPLCDDDDINSAELAEVMKVFDQAATTGSAQPSLELAVTPCAFWPPTHRQPTVPVHNTVPAIVVGATGERRRTHGVYPSSTCVNDAVNAYLNTGHLPAHDLACARPADQ